MTEPAKRSAKVPTLQQQIDALAARIDAGDAALAARIDAGDAMRQDTHNKVSDLHRALMEPQLGQGNKSLIERMAEVTVEIESGKRTADSVLSIAKWLVGVAAAVAALAAMLKFGIPKE
jgi:hypothetical protein